MKVYIRKHAALWVLSIESEQVVYTAIECKRLQAALEAACLLQLHVDNLNELTFETQAEATFYLNKGA